MSIANQKTGDVACALGIRVHSGWGAAVVVASGNGSIHIVERRRIQITSAHAVGAAQPYHFAEKLAIGAAEKHLASCAAESTRLASEGIAELLSTVVGQGLTIQAAVILLNSARPLPELPRILAAHTLIHSAEGEFFRQAFRTACQSLSLPVTGIRERDLEQQSAAAFGRTSAQVRKRIDALGKIVGPPWTADQKTAALAAAIVLASKGR